MAKTRTEKCKYPSRYSPDGWVHAAQYITELICEKKAKTEGKELPLKFWDLKEWGKFYRYQITLANKLLENNNEHSVIAALNDKRTFRTYSLRAPFLQKIIDEYKKKEEIAKKIMKSVSYDFKENKKHDSNNTKRSVISKLKDLE